tara:strand:+ start:45 stop:782 length:738 start_codon:yes stop_codon:yes gene_type:complete
MATIAGMDLGYGSQVKIVQTNFLVAAAGTNGTAQAHANFLHLYNRTVGSDSGAKADYIIPSTGAAADSPTGSTTDPLVADCDASTGTNGLVHLIGPSRSHLAQQSDLAAHQNSAADIGLSANGKVLAVLSVIATPYQTGTDFTGLTVTETLATTSTHTDNANSNLLVDSLGGPVSYIDISSALADLHTALGGTANLDFTDADLNANFVMKGNATEADETTLADITSPAADTTGLISVVALVRTAQ